MFSRETGARDFDRLARLVEATRRLASESDRRELLPFLLESAIALTGAERAFFLLRRNGSISCEAAMPVEPANRAPLPSHLSSSVLTRVLDRGESILSTDLGADERFRTRPSVRRSGLRSVLAVPFPGRDGAEGALYLDSRVSHTLFRHEDLDLLGAFAAQAAVAIERAPSSAEPPSPAARPGGGTVPNSTWIGQTLLNSPRRPRRHGETVQIVGQSASMQRALELARRVGPTELPVLIIGESGTGKELIARAIHESSSRRDGAFVAENCAAIPETLLESELFGSVRGAYTGAERDREGLFRAAERGTLFLDEIGEMPLPFQARLLRALQEREVRPVGAPRAIRVDVRIVAAMNRDPAAAIAARRLRLDLYYRIAGVTIEIPPLRDRREDIPVLAAHFLSKLAAGGTSRTHRLSPDALACLATYDWPGNVRELENEIERAAVLAAGEVIGPEDLSLRLSGPAAPPSAARVHPAERTMIEAALLAAEGSVTAAAEAIGWSRQKLYRRMSRLGIARSFGRSDSGA